MNMVYLVPAKETKKSCSNPSLKITELRYLNKC